MVVCVCWSNTAGLIHISHNNTMSLPSAEVGCLPSWMGLEAAYSSLVSAAASNNDHSPPPPY
jgi:hypothetical protein